jgi:hypothetical protein
MKEFTKLFKGVSFTDSLKNYIGLRNVSLCQFLFFLNITDIAQQIVNNFYSDKDWHFRYNVSAMIKFAVVKNRLGIEGINKVMEMVGERIIKLIDSKDQSN